MIIKARVVKGTIEQYKQRSNTMELIKWAHFLGAVSDYEYGDLIVLALP